MENLLVWILIFAGATIGLLATFLIASERELKAQRDEGAEWVEPAILKPTAFLKSAPGIDPLLARGELDELQQQNHELLREVTLLKDQLQSSQSTGAILQGRVSALERDKVELVENNGVLLTEIEQLKHHRHNIGALSDESSQQWEPSARHNPQLECEMDERPPKTTGAGELEAEIESLKKLLTENREQETNLAEAQQELAERAQLNRELKDDNYRLREEILALQNQLDSRVKDSQRLLLAQQWLSGILAKHQALTHSAQEMQHALGDFSDLLINQAAIQPSPSFPAQPQAANLHAERAVPLEPMESDNSGLTDSSNEPPFGSQAVPFHSTERSEQGPSDKSGRMVAVALFLLGLGALATQSWRLDQGEHPRSQTYSAELAHNDLKTTGALSPSPTAESALRRLSNPPAPRAQDVESTPHKSTNSMARRIQSGAEEPTQEVSLRRADELRQPPLAKNQQRRAKDSSAKPTAASYAIIQPTAVYSEPNENSASIAQIDTGMDVSVVNAHNDWLEIRSKHGRPPGFIKKDTAVRQGQN